LILPKHRLPSDILIHSYMINALLKLAAHSVTEMTSIVIVHGMVVAWFAVIIWLCT
jgi:hypothetical protein